jgi:hypothetical protein
MKFVKLTFSFILLFFIAGNIEAKDKPISKDVALKAIAIFEKEPLTENGKGAAAIIASFAEESEAVTVKISSAVTPWYKSEKEYKNGHLLLVAFIAGNIKSQLERKVCADDSHAGLLQLFKTYDQFKKADKNLKIPEIDHLVELHSKNKLKEYLEEAAKKEAKESK